MIAKIIPIRMKSPPVPIKAYTHHEIPFDVELSYFR